MIPAKLEHYTCTVGLLGLAGHPQEAENVIHRMPCKPKAAVWMGLLCICRIHGTVEMAECVVAKRVLELEPKRAARYVLLPNLSAAASAGGNLDLSEDVNHRERKKHCHSMFWIVLIVVAIWLFNIYGKCMVSVLEC
jgi:hypothetical protein